MSTFCSRRTHAVGTYENHLTEPYDLSCNQRHILQSSDDDIGIRITISLIYVS